MSSVVRRIAVAWATVGGLIILSIVLVTTANVGAFTLDRVARLFGGTVSGLPGYEDFVRLAVSVAALMFLPMCQIRRGHVAVEIFANRLPPRLREAIDAAWLVVTATLALFLSYWMIHGMVETWRDGALSRVLGWPEWPFYAPGVLSLALWAAVCVVQLIDRERHG